MISGVLLLPTESSPPNKFYTAAVATAVLGQRALEAIFFDFNSEAKLKDIILMPYLEMV
eukprot:CAMPEP_0114576180 /NCGR_PEP_ID=MMETSP0125-20121206/971_1 /TAXON_ID=485358 ORGANISM="Aristerostoma sp., Strain ATCC 50986" /NCGR_SAMPLE_ID=MMETSP0125 /ASSEMBLY_ACC=CAM_ASM_000245 /LENGTH=58 /DNA_ID=CAMNT_0001764495 /DNA_START=200 /DNA_END=376 /DNA_ORIENTATION=+